MWVGEPEVSPSVLAEVPVAGHAESTELQAYELGR